jgi:hypothetical protein
LTSVAAAGVMRATWHWKGTKSLRKRLFAQAPVWCVAEHGQGLVAAEGEVAGGLGFAFECAQEALGEVDQGEEGAEALPVGQLVFDVVHRKILPETVDSESIFQLCFT